jgi:hypothetical protein
LFNRWKGTAMQRTSLCALVVAMGLVFGAAGAQAANLILNGGFEDGVYTSTIGGNTNTQVPVNWDSTAAFDLEPSFNHVSNFMPLSGSFDLSIGNFDFEPLATLTQTFSDVSGDSYTVNFWAFDGGAFGDAAAFLTVSVGSQSVTFDDTTALYTLGTFTFLGTGSDTLTIAAQTNPSEWFVDDVSVVGTAIPEASTWSMTALGFAGLAFAGFRRTKRTVPPLSAA